MTALKWITATLVAMLAFPAHAAAAVEADAIPGPVNARVVSVYDGDMEGEAVWLRIVKAIEELLSEERPEGEKVH